MQILKDKKYILLKKNNLLFEKEDTQNTIKLSNSLFDKKMGNNIANVIRENTKERNEKNEPNNYREFNGIISYFYSTAQYLKDSNEYNRFHISMINSKNYIPKIVLENKNYEDYENNNTKKNYFINNKKFNNFNYYNFEQKSNADNNKIHLSDKNININYLANINVFSSIKIGKGLIYNNPLCIKIDEEKNISNGYYKLFDNNINYPIFFPSNYNKKEDKNSDINSNHSEKTESTSSLSEKGEDNCNFNYSKNGENLQQKTKEDEYLTEMFGKKGWICFLCNNFNYQTRNKCNRCGAMKKPKKIINNKERNKEIKESKNNKDDWICMNCNNFNFSFRNVCNICKCFRINKIKCYPLYSFTPSFNIFNIINNVNKQFN